MQAGKAPEEGMARPETEPKDQIIVAVQSGARKRESRTLSAHTITNGHRG